MCGFPIVKRLVAVLYRSIYSSKEVCREEEIEGADWLDRERCWRRPVVTFSVQLGHIASMFRVSTSFSCAPLRLGRWQARLLIWHLEKTSHPRSDDRRWCKLLGLCARISSHMRYGIHREPCLHGPRGRSFATRLRELVKKRFGPAQVPRVFYMSRRQTHDKPTLYDIYSRLEIAENQTAVTPYRESV